MPAITVRPAQGNDFHPMQAMSNGESGASCYPSFVSASHRFFVACDGFNVVGFVCAYPGREANAGYVQLMEPYLYTLYRDQEIEDTLKAAVLEWAEQRLDLHFLRKIPSLCTRSSRMNICNRSNMTRRKLSIHRLRNPARPLKYLQHRDFLRLSQPELSRLL